MRNRILRAASLAICLFAIKMKADDAMSITNILQAFTSDKYYERMEATNRIDSFVCNSTNTGEVAECRLLKSVILLECSMKEHSRSAYDEATNLCQAVKGDYSGDNRDWHYWASSLIELQALAQDEQYLTAYSVATNVLSFLPPSDFERSTNTWNALFGTDIPEAITLSEAFRVNAADALLSVDKTSDLYSITNGLSSKAMETLNAIIISK